MNIAFFDFDGTITTHDSLIGFIRFVFGDIKFLAGLAILSPMLMLYKLKLIPNYQAKQMMLSYFFKGMHQKQFENTAYNYSINEIPKIVRSQAMEKIKWHQDQGDHIVVVSASIECWLKAWCAENSFDLIATILKFENEIITGKLLTKNCYGIEKVNRIKDKYDLQQYDSIFAYGDSQGDTEMLQLATISYYKYFNN